MEQRMAYLLESAEVAYDELLMQHQPNQTHVAFIDRERRKYRFRLSLVTQVDDSGLWKRADPAGKMRESHRILQENTRKKLEHGSSILTGSFRIFSGDFPAGSREKFIRKWLPFTRTWLLFVRKRSEFTRENPATFRTFPAKIHKQMVMIHRKWSEFTRKRSEFTRKWSKFTRKKSGDFRPEYCFHVPTFFRCFPAGTGPYYLTWVDMLSVIVKINVIER
jgi:hypothetical protein